MTLQFLMFWLKKTDLESNIRYSELLCSVIMEVFCGLLLLIEHEFPILGTDKLGDMASKNNFLHEISIMSRQVARRRTVQEANSKKEQGKT